MLFWVAVACVGALIWWYFNSRPAVTTVAANRSAAPAAPQEQDPRADEEKAYRLQQTLEAEQAARDEDMEKSYPYSDTCPTSNRDSNLRAGPSVDYAVIGTVQAGACIPVAAQNADGTWYWFQKEDVFGPNVDVWIRSYLVDNVPPNLPIVDTRSRSTPVSPRQQAQGCPGGCTTYPSWCAGIPIKGNISQTTGERIYHVAGQRYYNDTNIDPTYGERWFCTETEAREAGWRKSVR
jgi:hypothetical protein